MCAARPELVRLRLARLPLLALGLASLGAGVWGGLLRLPVAVPTPGLAGGWLLWHGPLMVCCFLGTVIGLERAVGLQMWWPYGAPILTAAGALGLIGGAPGPAPVVLLTLGSAWYAAVAWRIVGIQAEKFTIIMAVGATAWTASNLLWLGGRAVFELVPWWVAFLGLTIIGERLDLGRFQKRPAWAVPVLLVILGVMAAGVGVTLVRPAAGERLLGAGLVLAAVWLARFDIARTTVRHPGQPRFMAVCLLAGYVWMAAAGAMLVAFAPLQAGLRYDAALHSFFLGFVFSMIFGHAPVIFPAVLVLPPFFTPAFYGHVVVLHAGLALRVVGDLAGWVPARQWGGAIGGVALALFLANTVRAVVRALTAPKPTARK
ncbi:MAG: hypothetical protein HZA93_03790 [Verrucomicrobia bacterium]|nr:hypothetical protein [Verrucomicrobiota bacterium]